MAEHFIYTKYSVEDIESYLNGRMNAKDMHEMERAALQDPFLADAIEGLQNAPFTETYKHLDNIALAINGEKQPAKIVPLPIKTNYWLRAAVITGIIVITGAALWLTQGNNGQADKHVAALPTVQQKEAAPVTPLKMATDNAKVIADNAKKSKPEKKYETLTLTNEQSNAVSAGSYLLSPTQQPVGSTNNLTAATLADSIKESSVLASLNGKVSGLVVQAPANADKKALKQEDTAFINNRSAVASIGKRKALIENYNTAYKVAPSGPTANMANNQANTVTYNAFANQPWYNAAKFEGFVVDDKNQPLANATVYSVDKKQATLTDSKGYFTLNTADSQLAVNISSAGYITKQIVLKQNAPNFIPVNPLPSLTSVEVLEFKNTHLNKKLLADSLFPEGGWQSFREYVYKKLHKEKDMDTTGAEITMLDKSVEIEFTVDENGLAKDLKITKSLNGESDAKAVEVIKQWPHWVATRKDKKGKVVIQF